MMHSQTYIVGNGSYIAEAYFMSNMLHIENSERRRIYSCCLDDYTNYQGNMESFVNEIVSLKDEGLSQTKITMKLKGIN